MRGTALLKRSQLVALDVDHLAAGEQSIADEADLLGADTPHLVLDPRPAGAGVLAHLHAQVGDERHEGADLLQRAGLIHPEAGEGSGDHDVDREVADHGRQSLAPPLVGETELGPRPLEDVEAAAYLRASPAVELALQL